MKIHRLLALSLVLSASSGFADPAAETAVLTCDRYPNADVSLTLEVEVPDSSGQKLSMSFFDAGRLDHTRMVRFDLVRSPDGRSWMEFADGATYSLRVDVSSPEEHAPGMLGHETVRSAEGEIISDRMVFCRVRLHRAGTSPL